MVKIRLLTPDDQPQLEAFLRMHASATMILRSNLTRSGITDGPTAYHGRYAAAFDGKHIVGVAARYWNGMLIVYAPRHVAGLAALAADGQRLVGILGPWQQALDAQEAVGMDSAHHKLRSREVLMTLPLAKLKIPAPLLQGQTLHCRLATQEDQTLIQEWRIAYTQEALGATPSAATSNDCAEETARWIAEKSQFILLDNGRPVSGCTFNARLPESVQVGNVWTPPECRSRGYARAVVAGALDMIRREGVENAVLFTAADNVAAQTAYLALGFTAIGDYAILLFAN